MIDHLLQDQHRVAAFYRRNPVLEVDTRGIVVEEVEELRDAILNDGSKEHVAKEMADVLFVILAHCNTLGINFSRVWEEVCRSNDTKQYITRRNKGPDYKPADLSFVNQVNQKVPSNAPSSPSV